MCGEREVGPPRKHQPARHRETDARGRDDSHHRRRQAVPSEKTKMGWKIKAGRKNSERSPGHYSAHK